MWAFLRDRRLAGYKLRRQHSIGPYSVDFVSLSEKLVIELDGGQHAEQTHYDEKRTRFLQSRGYRVMRYWDHEMLLDPELVLDDVLLHLQTPFPSPRSDSGGKFTPPHIYAQGFSASLVADPPPLLSAATR